MRKKKVYIFLIILLVIIGAGIYAYCLYNKPHRDVQNTEAAFSVKAADLYKEFSVSENKATTKYSGQVIVVEGTILNVLSTDTTANILLKTDDDIFGVNCALLPEKLDQTRSLQKNQFVKIKGECQGIIDDVILSKCAIIK